MGWAGVLPEWKSMYCHWKEGKQVQKCISLGSGFLLVNRMVLNICQYMKIKLKDRAYNFSFGLTEFQMPAEYLGKAV